MLRRRYYPKEEAVGKTKRRQKAYATVRHRAGAKRGIHRCAEDGFLIYSPAREEDVFPWPESECLCFTGHRRLSILEQIRIQQRLEPLLEEYYGMGKRIFLSGGALGFDTLAARAVLSLRGKHPDAQLVIAAPCRSQASRWAPADQREYRRLLTQADQNILISEEYFSGCMQKRNRFLVDHADTCLCYLTHCRGGTWNTVSYAYDTRRTIVNIAEK